MDDEVIVDLSPTQGATASYSPFDEARAGRDLYYATTSAAERSLDRKGGPSQSSEARLAHNLQEMEFSACCGVVPSPINSTRQAASISRSTAVASEGARRRDNRLAARAELSTRDGAARADRLAHLRAQLNDYLKRDPAVDRAGAATPHEACQPHSPSYDPDIQLSHSPVAPAPEPREGASPTRAGEVVEADAYFSPPPRLATPSCDRPSHGEPSVGLFLSSPSPSPEANHDAPEPHRGARLSSLRASPPRATTTTVSRSVGYSSARESPDTVPEVLPSAKRAAISTVGASHSQRIRCDNCLVEDEVCVSHPRQELPRLRFCPFCGCALTAASLLS